MYRNDVENDVGKKIFACRLINLNNCIITKIISENTSNRPYMRDVTPPQYFTP
eukprot:TRINITY_DN3932_c0_g1_i1.p3 TRINITY_DN3932_c0_g1~~TRINITY_DN3932_c0_g1_i1.p3  ORF type:complete len:53 (+),score=1.18 TRINITY_DN3932_c0_g1_i1:405-563(+)